MRSRAARAKPRLLDFGKQGGTRAPCGRSAKRPSWRQRTSSVSPPARGSASTGTTGASAPWCAAELAPSGWVVDFNELGKELRTPVEPWEHVFLNELAPFDDLNPTAENLARVVADGLAAKIDDARVKVARVEVWENDTC